MTKRHDERCKECKKRIGELLFRIYGNVKIGHNLGLLNKPEAFKNTLYYNSLAHIFELLQKHRDHKSFVRAKKLPNVDFFVPSPGFILEFDESQHFSKPREIALSNYPDRLQVGFNKSKWEFLCGKLHTKDNDPPYRDEQRAWYDTLRDFAPSILNLKPTIRLFARDYVWCDLNVNLTNDLNKFKNILNGDVI